MSVSFFDLMKYASTGIASPSMTAYDKMRALAAFGGGKTRTLTGVPPLYFKADGTPLISWSMKGNGQQTGTPTPDAPIMPEFCGKLVNTDWTIPVTCAGQTVPVYLGQVQTVRRVKKLVLTGTENISNSIFTTSTKDTSNIIAIRFRSIGMPDIRDNDSAVKRYMYDYLMCSHYGIRTDFDSASYRYLASGKFGLNSLASSNIFLVFSTDAESIDSFKSYLATQYANGTPVTVWYVLAEPTTGIVNEPLYKISDYADELHSEDAGVSIPTAKGQNTLTVDTELQPSEMTITGNIKEMRQFLNP